MYDQEYLENLSYVDLLALGKELGLTKGRVKKEVLISLILEFEEEASEEQGQNTSQMPQVVDRRATFDVPPEMSTSRKTKGKKRSKKGKKRSGKNDSSLGEEPRENTTDEAEKVEAPQIFSPLEEAVESAPEEGASGDDRRGTFTVEETSDFKGDSLSLSQPRKSRRKWSSPKPIAFNVTDALEISEVDKENQQARKSRVSRRETFDVDNMESRKADALKSKTEIKNAIDMLPTFQITDSPVNRPLTVFERLATPMSLKERRSICTVKPQPSMTADQAHRVALLSAIRTTRSSTAGATGSKRKSQATPRKVPNFARIHEKQFNKMTSIVDFKKRQIERAQQFLSPVRLVKAVEKAEKIVAVKKRSMLPVLKKPPAVTVQNSTVSSSTEPGLRKQLKEAIKHKTPAATRQSLKEKTRASTKEVRMNKRFRLLYESSRQKKAA